MSKVTVIPSDNVVGVDRVFRKVDMTGIDPAIHAVQFDTVKALGEIEYEDKPNERITDMSQFQFLRDRWTAAAPPPPVPPTAAELAEQNRLAVINGSIQDMKLGTTTPKTLTELKTMTFVEYNDWFNLNFDTAAKLIALLKILLLVVIQRNL